MNSIPVISPTDAGCGRHYYFWLASHVAPSWYIHPKFRLRRSESRFFRWWRYPFTTYIALDFSAFVVLAQAEKIF
jgi:hypothetical protein